MRILLFLAVLSPSKADLALQVVETDWKLPEPLSDFTATVIGDQIYVAGGCNSPLGNAFVTDRGEFVCGSLSSSLYRLDPSTKEIVELAELPTARYRHAAVGDDESQTLWLVGGRSLDQDTLIDSIDVYSIVDGDYRTFALPQERVASDHTGFAHNGTAYFAGGYSATYEWLDTLFGIDITTTLSDDNLTIIDKAPMLQARGDVASAATLTSAIVGGGFGPTLGWCQPAPEMQAYDFASDTWSMLPDITISRSDKAMVVVDDNVFCLGGERQIENACAIDEPEPGELTVAVDDVEVLSDNQWTVLDDLKDHRFRWAAVALQETIYLLGGQQAYSADCQCYRTSDEITVHVVVERNESNASGSSGDALSTSGASRRGYSMVLVWIGVALGWAIILK